MQTLVTHIAWTVCGLKSFEGEINTLLSQGWRLAKLDISKRGLFRIICVAVLTK